MGKQNSTRIEEFALRIHEPFDSKGLFAFGDLVFAALPTPGAFSTEPCGSTLAYVVAMQLVMLYAIVGVFEAARHGVGAGSPLLMAQSLIHVCSYIVLVVSWLEVRRFRRFRADLNVFLVRGRRHGDVWHKS